MIDLTDTLERATSNRMRRTNPEAGALVRKIADVLGARIDWDQEAGEDWASLHDVENNLVALCYALAPLVLCRRPQVVLTVVPVDTAVVEMPGFDDQAYTADAEALERLFGNLPLDGDDFNAARFSAHDLYFWTV